MRHTRGGTLTSLSLVRLNVVNHVAHLARLDIATQAAQKLVCAACCLVDDETLGEAHVAGVWTESVSNSASFDDRFMERASANRTKGRGGSDGLDPVSGHSNRAIV